MTPEALRALFRAQRAAFAAHYPHVAKARLYIVDRRCPQGTVCAPRDLAWQLGDGIHILKRALRLSRPHLEALVAHELSHLGDLRRHEPGSEQRADDIAERVLGRRIRYSRKTLVQTFGPGLYPRPKSLHS